MTGGRLHLPEILRRQKAGRLAPIRSRIGQRLRQIVRRPENLEDPTPDLVPEAPPISIGALGMEIRHLRSKIADDRPSGAFVDMGRAWQGKFFHFGHCGASGGNRAGVPYRTFSSRSISRSMYQALLRGFTPQDW